MMKIRDVFLCGGSTAILDMIRDAGLLEEVVLDAGRPPVDMLRTISERIADLLGLEGDEAERMHAEAVAAGALRWTFDTAQLSSEGIDNGIDIGIGIGKATCGTLFAISEVFWGIAMDGGRIPSQYERFTDSLLRNLPDRIVWDKYGSPPEHPGRLPGTHSIADEIPTDVLMRATRAMVVAKKLIESVFHMATCGFDVSGIDACDGGDLDVLSSVITGGAGKAVAGELVERSRRHLQAQADNYVLRSSRRTSRRPAFALPGISRIDVPIDVLIRQHELSRNEQQGRRSHREICEALGRVVVKRRGTLVRRWREDGGADGSTSMMRSYASAVAEAASVTFWWAVDDASIDLRSLDPAPPPDRSVFGDVVADMPGVIYTLSRNNVVGDRNGSGSGNNNISFFSRKVTV